MKKFYKNNLILVAILYLLLTVSIKAQITVFPDTLGNGDIVYKSYPTNPPASFYYSTGYFTNIVGASSKYINKQGITLPPTQNVKLSFILG